MKGLGFCRVSHGAQCRVLCWEEGGPHLGFRVKGCGVYQLSCRERSLFIALGSRVETWFQGPGDRSGSRVQGPGFRVQGINQAQGSRVQGPGFRVQGLDQGPGSRSAAALTQVVQPLWLAVCQVDQQRGHTRTGLHLLGQQQASSVSTSFAPPILVMPVLLIRSTAFP